MGRLRADLAARAAGIHAAQAELVALVGEVIRTDAWNGPGIASIGHWGSIELGLPARVVNDMADTACYLAELPLLSAEFSSGRLGFDKVRAIAAVATPEMEATFVELALHGSVEQLRRITRAYAREHPEDDKTRDPDRPDPTPGSRRRNRGLWCERNPDGDGLVRLVAKLAPDDAALVMAAVAAHAEAQWRDEHGDPPDDETRTEGPDPDDGPAGAPTSGEGDDPSRRELNPSVPDATGDAVDPEPFHPRPARLADGLVGLARTGLTEGPSPVTDGEPAEVVLRVDRAFLAGETDTGICQADFGPTLPRSSARRLACDCLLTTMVHDALGRPLGIGRASRTVPRWLRRALKDRDGGCVFPGCSHTAYVEAHHIWHWADGGPTDLANLVLVCVRHHKAVHDHHLRVILHESGRVEVRRADGTPIMRPPEPASHQDMPRPRTDPGDDPRALDGGDPRWSLDLTLTGLACTRRATAPPG